MKRGGKEREEKKSGMDEGVKRGRGESNRGMARKEKLW